MPSKFPELKLLHKGLILVLVPLTIQLIFIATLYSLLTQADYQTQRATHARNVLGAINDLQQDLFAAGRTGALLKLMKQAELRDQLTENMQKIFVDTDKLKVLTSADPAEHAAYLQIEPALKDVSILIEDSLRKNEKRELLPQIPVEDLTKQLAGQAKTVNQTFKNLSDIEEQIESSAPIQEARTRESVMLWIVAGVTLDIIVAIGLAIFFNKQLLGKLIIMMDNTRRLAKNEPLLPCTAGGDELAHLDKTFHEMADALHEAAEYKKELVSMVSHDLRTPLTSIQTSLALIEVGACGDVSDRAKSEIAVAERSATRLINLINDLLDIEKMEAGKLEMNLKPSKTLDIVYRSVEAVGSFAEQHEIQFKITKDDYDFNADAERLVQVLVNLLSNAIKFSPDGSTITLDVIDAPVFVEFRVGDEGPGIPPEYKDKLFERFKQVEGVSSTKLKGTGLGLAICKAIVQGHYGEIGLDSEVGKGTTFWFRIPKVPSPALQPSTLQPIT